MLRDDGAPMTIDVNEYVKGDSHWYTQLIEEAKIDVPNK